MKRGFDTRLNIVLDELRINGYTKWVAEGKKYTTSKISDEKRREG